MAKKRSQAEFDAQYPQHAALRKRKDAIDTVRGFLDFLEQQHGVVLADRDLAGGGSTMDGMAISREARFDLLLTYLGLDENAYAAEVERLYKESCEGRGIPTV